MRPRAQNGEACARIYLVALAKHENGEEVIDRELTEVMKEITIWDVVVMKSIEEVGLGRPWRDSVIDPIDRAEVEIGPVPRSFPEVAVLLCLRDLGRQLPDQNNKFDSFHITSSSWIR